MISESTFGGGVKALGRMTNPFSTLQKLCIQADNAPYVLLPSFARMRSATSFCIMKTALDNFGTWLTISHMSGEATL